MDDRLGDVAGGDLNRANLFLNHSKAKHSESCWNCDQTWPCVAVAAMIDSDHEWAQWFEKWTAALDVSANALAEVERLQSELAAANERAETAMAQMAEHLMQCPQAHEAAREALRSTPACRVCATKAAGLPTPGYTHDAGCPAQEPKPLPLDHAATEGSGQMTTSKQVKLLGELRQYKATIGRLLQLHNSYESDGEPMCSECGSCYPCYTVKTLMDARAERCGAAK